MKLKGIFLGAAVRKGEERTNNQTGEVYTSADRFMVCLGSGYAANVLPDYYECDSHATMKAIQACEWGSEYEFDIKKARYGRLAIAGVSLSSAVAPAAGAAD